jgi:hypothetical protein
MGLRILTGWPWALALVAVVGTLPARSLGREIVCEGRYGGHLQGIAVDEAGNLYWSFTVDLVKTDARGKLLKRVTVPSHHGDVTCHDDNVYCAVNLGEFNRQPGHADNWIYVFEAGDLSLVAKHKIPEVVHGAGGMAYRDGHFFVVGGLPEGYQENYVYQYDRKFRFVKRHVIPSGYTRLGIQTTCYAHGAWWFGCYGNTLLKTDESFNLLGKYHLDFGVGIAGLPDGKLLKGATSREEGRWRGSAIAVAVPSAESAAKTTE